MITFILVAILFSISAAALVFLAVSSNERSTFRASYWLHVAFISAFALACLFLLAKLRPAVDLHIGNSMRISDSSRTNK